MNNTYTNRQERAIKPQLTPLEILSRDIDIWRSRLRNAEEMIRVATVVITHLEQAQDELTQCEEL